jgi:lipopolysaccharide biosynthesis glycosyltransferase
MDIDIVVLGDVVKIYNEDLEGYAIGGVYDYVFTEKISDWGKMHKTQDLELELDAPYFNSGILLFDCKQWRENKITEEMFEIEKQFHDRNLKFVDQDILNIKFSKQHKHLDKAYNYTTLDKIFDVKVDNIIVRHFPGESKPWRNTDGDFGNFKDWWYFASMTPFYKGLELNFIANVTHESEAKVTKFIKERLKQ